jgi:hypothetical protein
VGLIGECEQQGLGEVGLVMAGKDAVVVGCSSGKSCSNRRWLSGGKGGCGGSDCTDWPFGGEGDRDLRGFEGFDFLFHNILYMFADFIIFFKKRVVSGRVYPIRPIRLNGFHGSCRVTREITVFVSCLEPQPANINGSCLGLS